MSSSPDHVFVYLLPVCLLFDATTAYPRFQMQIPNGENVPSPCDNQTTWLGVGHMTIGGGSTRNQFGLDFYKQGKKWTKALCQMDSDGDQRSNGEELGDPDCVWKPGQTPAAKATSHPGICEPLSSPECHSVTEWVSCDPPAPLHCDQMDENETTKIDLRLNPVGVPSSETTYICQMFDLDLTSEYHMIATQPLVVAKQVVHHILLFGCDGEVTSEAEYRQPYNCVMVPHPACRNMIGGWTVGSPGDCAHPDMGFRVGKGGYRTVALQVHFNNPQNLAGLIDTSGFRLFLTDQLRPNDAGMFVIGQRFLQIEPLGQTGEEEGPAAKMTSLSRQRSTSRAGVSYGDDQVAFSAVCPSRCTQVMIRKPIYITAAINHMHYLGTSQRIEIYRNGSLHKVVTDQHNYNYDDPVIYNFEDPIMVEPGDELRTTCVYKRTSKSAPVCWGEATSDEMCFGFLTYFPSQSLRLPWCTSVKSLPSCDRHLHLLLGRHPIDNCEWWKFRNISQPQTKAMFEDVLVRCYSAKTGLHCSQKCRDIAKSITAHPCLQNDVGTYMIDRIKNYGKTGQMFIEAVMTCSCQPFQTCERKLSTGFLGTRRSEFCSQGASIPPLSATSMCAALVFVLTLVNLSFIIKSSS